MNQVKKKISLFLAVLTIIMSLPIGEFIVYGENIKPVINQIDVRRIYKDFADNEPRFEVLVTGNFLLDASNNPLIEVWDGANKLIVGEKGRTRLVYKTNTLGDKITVEGNIIDAAANLPSVSSKTPTDGRIDRNIKEISLKGNGFELIKENPDIVGGFRNQDKVKEFTDNVIVDNDNIKISETGNGKDILNFLKSSHGNHDVYFRESKKVDLTDYKGVTLVNEHIYENTYISYETLPLPEGLEVSPTRGPLKAKVRISSDKPLLPEDQMSVFMVKKLDDELTLNHISKFENYREEGGRYVFTFEVPESLKKAYTDTVVGDYFILLTNNINPTTGKPKAEVTSLKVLDQKFTVVDGSDSLKISQVNPNEGSSAGGFEASLIGRYIGSMSTGTHTPKTEPKFELTTSEEGLNVIYENGIFTPLSEITGGSTEYETLTREIKAIIGSPVKFTKDNHILNPKGNDNIKIILPGISDLSDPVKDVVVMVKTTVKYKDKNGVDQTLVFEEEDILLDGFTYLAIDYIPEITGVVPSLFPVDSNGVFTPENIQIIIHGKNFILHRYEEVVDGKTLVKYKYPIIDLAAGSRVGSGDYTINKNIDSSIEMKIYNDKGEEIDGRKGNNLGSKIVVTLAKDAKVDKDKVNKLDEILLLTNPILNSDPIEEDANGNITNMGSSDDWNIGFVNIDEIPDKVPSITEIIPRVIPTSGYKGAVIKGSNFLPGLKLYLDGEEIKTFKINDTGTAITFDLPPKMEGEYPVVVQNEEGGLDIVSVEYVKAYTSIKLIDFNPKKGSAGTLVTIKGSGFLRPANTDITDIDTGAIAKRLIGTSVLLGMEDVNDYVLDANGKIILNEYDTSSSGQNLFTIDDEGNLELSTYYHSVILVGEGKDNKEAYYSIYYDGKIGRYKISDSVDEYILDAKGGEITANLRGKNYNIEVKNKEIIFKEDGGTTFKSFKIKTPYKVEEGKIVGNKVKVLSDTELIFEVPAKPRRGYYDLTVINPDTMSASKTGTNGFLYEYQPDFNPIIKDIIPKEGSISGGYFIDIIAKESETGQFRGFIDNGPGDKTTVTIGSVNVDEKDIRVSPDGYRLTVKVPKYPGDLSSETDLDRKSVNVVVVNPDGGSDSRENGFTYVIPISMPKLDNIFKKEGQAAGGNIVILEGSQFRYFEPFDDKNNNTIKDEDESFNDLNKNKKFDDLRDRKVWVGDWNPLENGYTDNLIEKNLEDLSEEEWDIFVKPILPKIYFGGKEAKIVDFEGGRIEVIAPGGTSGTVKVYLVNNDYGRSNELDYRYDATNPQISRIAPDIGAREGGQIIQILGSNFYESKINLIEDENTKKEKTIQLVEFGDLSDENTSNMKYKLGDVDESGFDNSGKIEYRQAEVRVGNLIVKYDARDSTNKTLNFQITKGSGEDLKKYEFTYKNWDEKDIYLPINKLKEVTNEPEPKNYEGTELVKISLETIEGAQSTRRLRVDRGYSPESKLENSGHINLILPSYYTVGKTKVRAINPDKQEASAEFNYRNPASKPYITNLFRNGEEGAKDGDIIRVLVPFTGGSNILIKGLDFRKPAQITIGGQIVIDQNALEYSPAGESIPSEIGFKMPKVDGKYVGRDMAVTLSNPDGGSTTTEKIRIRFTKPETIDMRVDNIIPNSGPTKGGTEVTIYGNDFRETMEDYKGKRLKVYFERGKDIVEVKERDMISVEFDKIVLRTPAFSAGSTNVIIENPDGNQVRLLNGFTFTSDPRINSVVNPENEKEVINNISVEGGERIKLKGSDFLEGAKVIFIPKLKELGDKDESTGQILVIDGKRYLLESGLEGLEVEYIDGQNILVTTPQGKLGEKGVIVINPDGGVSNIYNLEYGIPEIGAPFDVRAELVYDEFIRVTWSGVRGALEYEIYVSVGDRAFEFVDSTELTSYAFKEIKPYRKYQFMVRAIGEFGTSKPLDESKSNIVRTGRNAGPQDLDGEIGENTQVNRQGNDGEVLIGSRDFTSSGYTIDLTRGKLAGVRNLTIRMPANIIGVDRLGEIRVISTDYNMNFNPCVFKNKDLEDNRYNSKAGVVFKITDYNGDKTSGQNRIVVGPRYNLTAETFIDNNRTKVNRLCGGISLSLDQNPILVKSRRVKRSTIGLSRYYNNQWIETKSVDRMAIYTMTGSRG